MELPISFGHGLGTHQPSWRQILDCGVTLPLADTVAHPRGIDARIDHQMCDVDILRPELARGALRDGAKTELGACECRIAHAASKTCGRTGKEDRAATPR